MADVGETTQVSSLMVSGFGARESDPGLFSPHRFVLPLVLLSG